MGKIINLKDYKKNIGQNRLKEAILKWFNIDYSDFDELEYVKVKFTKKDYESMPDNIIRQARSIANMYYDIPLDTKKFTILDEVMNLQIIITPLTMTVKRIEE